MKIGDVWEKAVPMAPFPKARPRVTRNGTFMPSKYQAQREELRAYCMDMPDFSDYLIGLTIFNIRPMPQSWSAKRRDEMDGMWCAAGPDADNAAGAVMDALFKDDKCVVSLSSLKVWGLVAQIEIAVTVLSTDPVPF